MFDLWGLDRDWAAWSVNVLCVDLDIKVAKGAEQVLSRHSLV